MAEQPLPVCQLLVVAVKLACHSACVFFCDFRVASCIQRQLEMRSRKAEQKKLSHEYAHTLTHLISQSHHPSFTGDTSHSFKNTDCDAHHAHSSVTDIHYSACLPLRTLSRRRRATAAATRLCVHPRAKRWRGSCGCCTHAFGGCENPLLCVHDVVCALRIVDGHARVWRGSAQSAGRGDGR